MAKKNKLKILVQGRGIEALASPDSEVVHLNTLKNASNAAVSKPRRNRKKHPVDFAPAQKQNTEEKIQTEDLPEMIDMENKSLPQCKIVTLDPDEDELKIIDEITFWQKEYIVPWDSFTCQEEKIENHFVSGVPITFKIDCAVSKYIAQLEAPCRIEFIAYDVRSRQLQKSYSFSKDHKIDSGYFRVSYTTAASSKGLFRFTVILSVPKTDLFFVFEGNYFQVV